jgi:drug/metabolite transporter (DMT)-like permease
MQSSTVLLSIVWGVLFYGDPVSAYIIVGAVVFLAGIVLVNLPTALDKG